jgi:predicted neutral ceramidase superfamily lipid hydrolase
MEPLPKQTKVGRGAMFHIFLDHFLEIIPKDFTKILLREHYIVSRFFSLKYKSLKRHLRNIFKKYTLQIKYVLPIQAECYFSKRGCFIILFKMSISSYLAIVWICFCIFFSIPLIKIIYDHIHNKPIVSQTVIDLAYSDCILYLFAFDLLFAIALCWTLMSISTDLDFLPSLIFSMSTYFALCNSLWSLTITGILRFISLIKNSESDGIQSLGPDDIAIWKIR